MLRHLTGASALIVGACLAVPAGAASVVIWPLDPTIAAGARAAALWIDNKGGAPVVMQVRALAWTQDGGENRYRPQGEVVVSPPLVTIAPGQRQLVRVIRLGAPVPQSGERSYRLLMDELPPPLAGGEGAAAVTTRLAVQMRYSVPLFTYAGPSQATNPALRARVETAGEGQILVLTNTGTQHARLMDLRVVADGRPVSIAAGLMGYVLPGATMRWPLPAAMPAGPLLVSVNGRDVSLADAAKVAS